VNLTAQVIEFFKIKHIYVIKIFEKHVVLIRLVWAETTVLSGAKCLYDDWGLNPIFWGVLSFVLFISAGTLTEFLFIWPWVMVGLMLGIPFRWNWQIDEDSIFLTKAGWRKTFKSLHKYRVVRNIEGKLKRILK
jgi:hypothetical protein